MKALVVDDSAVMRKVLIEALSQTGITNVGQAADGKEAVAAVLKEDFDIVLMDWNMPNMSGIEAVREIRSNGRQVPIIMVSTEAEKSRVVEALKSGANNYIIKPFKPEAIAERIQTTISEASK